MRGLLLFLFFIPSILFAQQPDHEKTLQQLMQEHDTVWNNYEIVLEQTQTVYKTNKKMGQIEDTVLMKEKAKKIIATLKNTITEYTILYEKGVAVYIRANKFTNSVESAKGDAMKEKDREQLHYTMDQIENFSSEITWNAEENREQTTRIIENLKAILSGRYMELEDFQSHANEALSLCYENLVMLKSMKKNIKTSEKYCKKLSKFLP